MILAIFDLQVTIQEKKFKTDFQDGNCGGHLVFPIRTILAIFRLQVTSKTVTKFKVNWPFGSGEEAKIDFQDLCSKYDFIVS